MQRLRGSSAFHEKAGMSQVCFSLFSLFLPVDKPLSETSPQCAAVGETAICPFWLCAYGEGARRVTPEIRAQGRRSWS